MALGGVRELRLTPFFCCLYCLHSEQSRFCIILMELLLWVYSLYLFYGSIEFA